MANPEPKRQADRYEVFNRSRTIGVAASPGGAVAGLYLHENTRKLGERALAREILTVASVAAMRGRLALREQIEAAAAERGQTVPAHTYEILPDVPTIEEYEQYKHRALRG